MKSLLERFRHRNAEPETNRFDFRAKKSNPWIGRLKVLLICSVVAGLWVFIVGKPYLRWDEPLSDAKDGAVLDEEYRRFTRYVTLFKTRTVYADEFGSGLPTIVWIKDWRDNEEPVQ